MADANGILGLDALAAPVDLATWAPAPVSGDDGLLVLATTGPHGFALHTRVGDVSLLPGVNLGTTTPGLPAWRLGRGT